MLSREEGPSALPTEVDMTNRVRRRYRIKPPEVLSRLCAAITEVRRFGLSFSPLPNTGIVIPQALVGNLSFWSVSTAHIVLASHLDLC